MEPPARRPSRFKRAAKWTAWLVPIVLAAGYLAVSILTADILTRAHNHPAGLDPLLVSPNATAWSVKTEDGLTLRGWYHPTGQRRHLVILVHGMWSSWDELAGLGHDLHGRGYDVLLFDLRGHGQSDPSRLFMGRRERGDLRAVLAWAKREGFTPDRVGWVGFSLGASTLLMEAAQNPNIRVAVIDSPYGNLPEILDEQLSKYSNLPRFFNPGILTAAHLAYGVRTDDLIPIRSARSWGRRPLLLIHGEADTTVPAQQARRLARAAGSWCQTVMVPGVEHAEAYRMNPARYVSRVDSFLQKNLTP
jgi:alpha-beta hydrolase superfamily lysophospholipase